MRIGCIFTAKNEELLIGANIAYHRHIGVTDFFLFLDHSTDRTRAIAERFPGIHIYENLGLKDLLPYSAARPGLDLELIHRKFAEHNGVRQVLHANMALEMCRVKKIDWLLHVDPDELVCVDSRRVERNGLAEFLAAADPGIGALIFENLELMTTAFDPVCPFEGRLFKSQAITEEAARGLPKTEVIDPLTTTKVSAGWFWGHTSGKLAARVHPRSHFTHFVHRFHTEGAIRTVPWLLHYNIASYLHFVSKYHNFRDFPAFTSFGHPVRQLRTLLVNVVNEYGLSEAALAEFYRREIAYTPQEIETIRTRRDDGVIRIDAGADWFQERGSAQVQPQ
jgi:hypothetical protein